MQVLQIYLSTIFKVLGSTMAFPFHVFTRRNFGAKYFSFPFIALGFIHLILLTSFFSYNGEKLHLDILFIDYLQLPRQEMMNAFFTTWQGLLFVAYCIFILGHMFNQFRFALGQIDPIYNGLPFLFKASMAGSDNVRKYKRITEPILAWIAVIVLWRLVDNWVLKLWFVSFALHLSYNGLISEKNRRDTIEAGVRQGWANARHARLLEESGVDE